MSWTRQQRMILAILPKISSVFSLFGSIWIIIEVATEGRKIHNPYHRLLLAMSVYDTLESFWNFGSTWPIVEGSPDIIWAVGNVATCEAQGFFLTLSVAVPIYNAMLSIYYILVINYRYTNTMLKKRVEPIMHFVAFFWSFGTASYSLATGLFNNANLWCWIAPLPLDCKDTITYGTVEDGNDKPCIRGDNVWVYRFGFYFIPLWFCIFFATACTLWVYRYVLARDRETLAYRRPNKQSSPSWWRTNSNGAGTQQPVNTASTKTTIENKTDNDNTTPKKVEKEDETQSEGAGSGNKASGELMDGDQSSSSSIAKRIDAAFNDEEDIEYEDLKDEGDQKAGDRDSTDEKSLDSIDQNEEFKKIDELVASCREQFGGEQKQSEDDEDDPDLSKRQDETESSRHGPSKSIRDRVKRWKSRRIRYAEDMPRTYEVFKQACYYLGAFYCTHIWSTSNRIVQTISGGGTVFPLIAFHSFFDPFQGFLNYLVYQRPRFLQLRKKHPEMGFWGIMIASLRFSFMDSASFRRDGGAFGDSNRNSRQLSFGGRSSRIYSRSSRNYSRISSRNTDRSDRSLGGRSGRGGRNVVSSGGGSSNMDGSQSGHFSERSSSKRFLVEEAPSGEEALKLSSRNSTANETSEYMKVDDADDAKE